MTYSALSCDELIRTCAESKDEDAWEEFVCRSTTLISRVVWRIARGYGENSSAIVEDLVQDTYIKICEDDHRLLKTFKSYHEGAFFGLLQVIAANVARDHFRSRTASKRGSGKNDLELSEIEGFVPASQTSGPAQIERDILLREIDAILSALCPSERDYHIFWLHYRQGLRAAAIAQVDEFGLTAKGVESILQRLRSQLRTKLAEQPSGALSETSTTEGIKDENTFSK